MKQPLIAIIPSYTQSRRIRIDPAYINAIREAGGLGVVIPYSDDPTVINGYAATFDGFLFSGGVDLDPIYYGEQKEYDSVEIDADRDRFELLLVEAIGTMQKPILGICRGHQLLNVAFGGSLYQHMTGHSQTEARDVLTQKVRVEEGTKLYAITGRHELLTNTFHHQAVKEVAPPFCVTARAQDGTVEAIEHTEHPFLVGVQWHPECFYKDQAHARKLFKAFVEAAK